MDTCDWLTAFLRSLHFKRDRLIGRQLLISTNSDFCLPISRNFHTRAQRFLVSL